ncbi:MAG TPA: hypothetical protein VD978_28640 [Azospirillum sp.]|nr:hypothetical protein [Azospirillum sp.]
MRNGNAVQSERIDSIKNWGNGTVNASLRGISMLEAEHALANVWRRVEEYGADAPRMRFCFRRDGSINIQFSFSNQAIAALVLNGLDTACREEVRPGRRQ